MSFICFVELESTATLPLLVRDIGLSPVNADVPPVFRVYGPEGFLAGALGTCSFLESGPIQGATNASPVVYTSANHGLSSGIVVSVGGVLGNGGANATGVVTVIDANTFSIAGSAGTGAWTSGGTWNTTGLYTYQVACLSAAGFAAGTTYTVLIEGTYAGTPFSYTETFITG